MNECHEWFAIHWLEPLQVLAYLDFALLTCSNLQVYELLSSLEIEVKLVWKGSRNASQICYILARFTCITSFAIFCITDLYQLARFTKFVKGCSRFLEGYKEFSQLYELASWPLNVNLLFVEIIFSLRTWALWERSRNLGIGLGGLILMFWGSTFGLLISSYVVDANIASYAYYISLTSFYFIIMTLVTVRAYRARYELNISFIRLVHTQGLMYYAVTFSISLCAASYVAVNGVSGMMYDFKIIYITRVIQLIYTHLACQMTLSLRAQTSHAVIDLNSGDTGTCEQDTTIPLGELNFRNISTQQTDAVAYPGE